MVSAVFESCSKVSARGGLRRAPPCSSVPVSLQTTEFPSWVVPSPGPPAQRAGPPESWLTKRCLHRLLPPFLLGRPSAAVDLEAALEGWV